MITLAPLLWRCWSYQMHILFCHDTYYCKKRDGTVLSYASFPYSLWERRFLPYFESITVIGRKKKLRADETGVLEISSGRNVDHILLPNIHSPIKRLTKYRNMYKRIKEQVERADAVIIRGPVEFGMMAAKAARKLGKPYAIDMCGCAYNKEYSKNNILSKLYAPIKFRRAQYMVKHASAVIYVTENFLQERYPTQGISAYASNVEIATPPEYVLNSRIERIKSNVGKFNIGLIGNFGSGLKGLDLALGALGIVNKYRDENPDKNLPDFCFKILGQGFAAQWQGLIHSNDLDGKVEFCGTIARGRDVLEWLDDIDIYLQPSLHEGLPRSLIEAMSRGCPALASDAGGAGELLSDEFIHECGDTQKLADQIISLMNNERRLIAAQNNFEKAKNYTIEELIPRRRDFWEAFASLAKERLKSAQM